MDMHEIAGLLAELGRGLPTWALTMTAWTGGLLALAWLADWALRRVTEPGLRMAFYVVVLVRVALPIDWETPVGVIDDATPVAAQISAAAPRVATPESLPAAIPTRTAIVDDVPVAPRLDVLGLGIFGAYVLVAGVLLVIVRRRVRHVDGMLAQSTTTTVLRGVAVHVHAHAGPMVVGVRRPMIVVPRGILESTEGAVLDAVLRHEQSHARHRDGFSALAMAVLCAIAWPVVPVWIAVARLRLLMELRADAAAVRTCDTPVIRGYRRLLLDLAQQRWPVHALAPGLNPVAALRARLAAMAAARPRAPWVLQLAFVAPLAIALLVVAARRPDDATTATPIAEATLDGGASPPIATDHSERVAPHCREHEGAPQIDGAARPEARYVLGLGFLASGRKGDAANELREAAWESAMLGVDLIAAESAAAMVVVLHGGGAEADEEALKWSRHAEAAIHRGGHGGPMAIEMHHALAAMAERSGDRDAALRHRAEAVAIDASCEVVSTFAEIQEGRRSPWVASGS